MIRRRPKMRTWKGVQGGVYGLVETPEQLAWFLEHADAQATLAVDTETDSKRWVRGRVAGFVIGWGPRHNYYIPVGHTTGEEQLALDDVAPAVYNLLGNPNRRLIYWNQKFDQHFQANAGALPLDGPLERHGLPIGEIHDGIPLVHLLDENIKKELKLMSVTYVSPQADKWEHAVDEWRAEEAKRRTKLVNREIVAAVKERRSELEARLFAAQPELVAAKKATVTSALKKLVRAEMVARTEWAKKTSVTYADVPIAIMAPYACADVHYTWVLWHQFYPLIEQDPSLLALYQNERALMLDLWAQERLGVKIDVPYLRKLAPELRAQRDELAHKIYAAAGQEFQIGSNEQLVNALLASGCRLTKLTKDGKKRRKAGLAVEPKHYSTDKEALEYLAATHEVAQNVMEWRAIDKIIGTYAEPIAELVDDQDFLHSTFNPNVSTGRMSSKEPNVQNIAGKRKDIKRSFIVPWPDEFLAVYIDYSQIELRILAHNSQDKDMLAAYPWKGKGLDLHSLTCADAVLRRPYEDVLAINEDESHPEHSDIVWFRTIAKRVNFGIPYGATGPTIQRQVSTPLRPVSVEECDAYIQGYFDRYTGVADWIVITHAFARRYGWVRNNFGRYRRLPDALLQERRLRWKRERAERQAVNYLIQGEAADMFKTALVRVNRFLRQQKARSYVNNVVHDDIQFYWHRKELDLIPQVVSIMQDWPQYSVPIIADASWSDTNWAEKRKGIPTA